jgi:hypothetical protein
MNGKLIYYLTKHPEDARIVAYREKNSQKELSSQTLFLQTN